MSRDDGAPRPTPAQAPAPPPSGADHVEALLAALPGLDVVRLRDWGRRLATSLPAGARLLAAGNGGSAAEAQHLTAELVGRFRDERPPMSAIALHAETSSLTAIGNDYGYEEAFARQVRAHGRPGDVLLCLSTSGRSENLLRAVSAARAAGLSTWALAGSRDCPLAAACEEVVAVDSASAATVQEAHLVAVHLICAAVDAALGVSGSAAPDGVSGSGTPDAVSGSGTPDGVRGSGAPHGFASGRRGAEAGRHGRRTPAPLVVIGDSMLDRDVAGRAERLAPDAPVPVVDSVVERARPGGAGLAALLAAADRRQVTLITALGRDHAGRTVAALLADGGVTVVDLGLQGATPQKVRVRADGRPLLRIDRGDGRPRPLGQLPAAARSALERAGAVLVADYGRGLTADPVVRDALAALPRRTALVWDPHPRGAPPVPGARLVTPNAAEARRLVPDVRGDGVGADLARARALVERFGATAVAVTRGAGGALLAADPQAPPLVVPAERVPAPDPCGAGDRLAATASGMLADGSLPSEAIVAAVASATRFVAAGGAAAVSRTPRPPDVPSRPPGVARRDSSGGGSHGEDPLALVARVRAAGGTVVATGGCFDLLHAGHVRMLEHARSLGDCLIVCLNSDDSVRRRKGPDRPLVLAADRAALLNALACVDGVIVFDEDTPVTALRTFRPDVFAKGADYAVADLPETPVVASWGGQTVVLPFLAGRSTSSLIKEVARRVCAP